MPSNPSQSVKIFCVLFACLVFFSFVAPSSSSTSNSDEKVSLALYYESLCPYCANFISNYLPKIFDNGLIAIIELKLIPWGNAKMRGNNTFDCQHGPSECLLNTVEACAIKVWPDLNVHFSFINCVETIVHEHKYPQWESCFDSLGLDPMAVKECYSSGYGKEMVMNILFMVNWYLPYVVCQSHYRSSLRTLLMAALSVLLFNQRLCEPAQLELQYAAETNALQPSHQYVPWVVVNGQPLYEDYENFISYVCKAYNGSAVPSACGGFSIKDLLKQKVNTLALGVVSHPEKDADLTLLMKIRAVIKSRMFHMIDGSEL